MASQGGGEWTFFGATPEVPLATLTSVWYGIDNSPGKGISMSFTAVWMR